MGKLKILALLGVAFFVVACAEKSNANLESSSNEQVSQQAQANSEPNTDNFVDVNPEPTPSEPEVVSEVEAIMPIYFGFDKYDISADMQEVVTNNVTYIKDHNLKEVLLEGNTDEFGTDEYNYALGLKRAIAVKDALILKGIDANIISTISYGESKPACQEKSNDCYKQNRRTDIVAK